MKPADRILNILTVAVLGLTVLSCICIGSVFVNPLGVFNFLGPATFPVPLSVPTLGASDSTPTEVIYPTLPPEWTATITPTETEVAPTGTPSPAKTEEAAALTDGTRTPFPSPVGPTETLTPTEQPTTTPKPPTPTRTATPGSYPGQVPSPTIAPNTPYP